MATRMQPVTPFQQGQSTNEHPDKPAKVEVRSRMAGTPRNGKPDPLMKALTAPPRNNFEPMHLMKKRPVSPRGHKYTPHTQWAPMKAKQQIKATDFGPRHSRPGPNAVGSNLNRKGGNALRPS